MLCILVAHSSYETNKNTTRRNRLEYTVQKLVIPRWTLLNVHFPCRTRIGTLSLQITRCSHFFCRTLSDIIGKFSKGNLNFISFLMVVFYQMILVMLLRFAWCRTLKKRCLSQNQMFKTVKQVIKERKRKKIGRKKMRKKWKIRGEISRLITLNTTRWRIANTRISNLSS